jgi:hypothetical protein
MSESGDHNLEYANRIPSDAPPIDAWGCVSCALALAAIGWTILCIHRAVRAFYDPFPNQRGSQMWAVAMVVGSGVMLVAGVVTAVRGRSIHKQYDTPVCTAGLCFNAILLFAGIFWLIYNF